MAIQNVYRAPSYRCRADDVPPDDAHGRAPVQVRGVRRRLHQAELAEETLPHTSACAAVRLRYV